MANSAAASSSSTLCSICWEEVSDDCIRTVVRLQCSHLFHLDCIGSAFNVSGIMQCPNCREIEHGVWRRFENNTEENGDDDSDDEDERNHHNMISHHCPGNNWCPRHGRIAGLPHPGHQDITQLRPNFTGDHRLYSPSVITNISSSGMVFPGHNLVHRAVLTPVCDPVIDANQTLAALATQRAPQCNAGGLPNFESAGHRVIRQPGRRSLGFPVWLPAPAPGPAPGPASAPAPAPAPAQNISLPPQQIVYHVPPLNLTIQNNPQAANPDPVNHSLSLSIQNNPTEPTLANDQVQERFETIQLLPDDMGPFRAPRN